MGFGSKIKRAIKDPKKAVNRTYHRVDEVAGKKIFGNTVGLQMNIAGSLQMETSLTDELNEKNPLAYQLRKDQVLPLDTPYESSLIDKISAKYNQMIENEEFSLGSQGFGGKVYCRHIRNPEKNFPELKHLISEKVHRIVSDYYGKNFCIKHINCHRNYHVPKEHSSEEVFSNHWHNDRRNISELKLFVYLSDVTEADGPFHYNPRDRTKYLMDKGFGARDNYQVSNEVLEDPEHMKKAIGHRGTAFFANANLMLHKAGIPEEGHYRDMVHIVFTPAKQPLPEDWMKDVEPITLHEYHEAKS